MIKSQFHQADNKHHVVTAADVGKEVQVAGIGHGVLRYVGGISGKEGLFCGIELDVPEGKHDGTFQGYAYFMCPPMHGIFAPLYKVELTTSPVSQMSHSPTFTVQGNERLSRSALPALNLKNVFAPAEPPRTLAEPMSMQSSVVSNGSSLMNNSFIMDGSSWLDGSMCASNTTYTLPKTRLLVDDEEEFDFMTSAIPKGKSLLKYLKDDTDENLSTSVVLPESRVGVENLPIIEDDETDQTPLVESRPGIGGYYNQYSNMMSGYHQDYHGAEYLQNGDNEYNGEESMEEDGDGEEEEQLNSSQTSSDHSRTTDAVHDDQRPHSSASADTGYQGDSDAQHANGEKKKASPQVNGKPAETTAGKAKPGPKMTAAALKRMEAAKKIEKEPKEPKQKKPSIRELQAAAAPKFPVKPKAPSKHQLMMEQIKLYEERNVAKASIEAEKNKPKKEKKERQSLLPASPPKEKKADENAPEDPSMTVAPAASNGVGRKKEPLKAANVPLPAVSKTPREPRKPRLSLLPPVPVAKAPAAEKDTASSSKKPLAAPSTIIKKPVSSASSTISLTNGKAKSAFPTSSFGRQTATGKTPAASGASARKSVTKKPIDEKEKLARLHHSAKAFEVMNILRSFNQTQADNLAARLLKESEDNGRKDSQIENLRGKLTQMDAEYRNKVEEMQRNMEQLTRAHEANLDAVRKTYEKQMDEKSHEHDRAVEEEKARHEGEVANLTRRHQAVCAQLDEKILEAEQTAEGLKKDKMALQNTLAKDNDSKVQMLTAEISSLQTALALKSQEMKELRQHNQSLTMQVEEIPSLTLEITKLKHKLMELRQSLDQKRNVEKALVSQNEELKRTALQISQMNQSIIQDMDVLRYQIEEKSDAGSMENSVHATPCSKVQFRTRSAAGGHGENRSSFTPNSSSRLSTSSHSELMAHSLDDTLNRSTVSMYATHRLSGVSGTDEDVIYAPDEILSSSIGSSTSRRSTHAYLKTYLCGVKRSLEEIPSLTLEITKLKHKLMELRQSLDQKRNVEKALVSQNEELKRTALQISQMNQSIIQDMDVLRYQIEEKSDAGTMENSVHTTPCSKVQFRTRSAAGGHGENRSSFTPNSSSRLSTSSHSELMAHSLDDTLNRSTVSMYATHRLSGVSGTDEDVIYAPDEILSSSIGSSTSRRSTHGDSTDNKHDPPTSAQTDSGIGI